MSEQPPAGPDGPPPWQPPPPPPPVPPYGTQPTGYPVPPVPMAPAATGKSTTALILGICGVVLCPLVLSVPAMVVGLSAKKEIDASQGRLGGRSQAQAGFVLGIIGTVIGVLATLLVVVVFAFGSAIEDAYEDTCTTIDQSTGEVYDC